MKNCKIKEKDASNLLANGSENHAYESKYRTYERALPSCHATFYKSEIIPKLSYKIIKDCNVPNNKGRISS